MASIGGKIAAACVLPLAGLGTAELISLVST